MISSNSPNLLERLQRPLTPSELADLRPARPKNINNLERFLATQQIKASIFAVTIVFIFSSRPFVQKFPAAILVAICIGYLWALGNYRFWMNRMTFRQFIQGAFLIVPFVVAAFGF